jgi:hypothetical protein
MNVFRARDTAQWWSKALGSVLNTANKQKNRKQTL